MTMTMSFIIQIQIVIFKGELIMSLAKTNNHNFNDGDFKLFNPHGNISYLEHENGRITRYYYDKNQNCTFKEVENEYWERYEYDENSNEIFHQNSYK